MNPKKSKKLIDEVAKEVPFSPDCIQAISNFYWREVWNSVTTLAAPKIHIENLGDFTIKHWLIDKEIDRSEAFSLKSNKRAKEKYMAGLDITKRIELLKNIKSQVEEENQRKEFIYEHKRNNKKDTTDLDGEVEDISRDME